MTFQLRQAQNLAFASRQEHHEAIYFLPIRTMENTKNITPQEVIDSLASALDQMMDIMLDGRMDELQDYEQEAYNQAAEAMNLMERSPYGTGNTQA